MLGDVPVYSLVWLWEVTSYIRSSLLHDICRTLLASDEGSPFW